MILLPAAPAVNDAYYFGAEHEYTILIVSISQQGVGTWVLVWEYYDGDSWEPLADVVDTSSGFQSSGIKIVGFTRPTNWAETTILSKTSFFTRARVSSFTSITTQPKGTEAFYETGQWWVWVAAVGAGGQEQFNLYAGGVDMVSNHQIFTGLAGIVTPDSAGIEPDLTYSINYTGRINFSTPATGSATRACIICKPGALELKVASPTSLTLSVTGSAVNTTLTLSGLTQGVSGSQVIAIDSNSSILSFQYTSESVVTSDTGTSRTVDNLSSNWLFAPSSAVDYTDVSVGKNRRITAPDGIESETPDIPRGDNWRR